MSVDPAIADPFRLCCSFCGTPAIETKKLIAGPNVQICDSCVDLCHGYLHDTTAPAASPAGIASAKPVPSPSEIKAFLDQYVIGQDHAKTVLAVAVYNHYKRLDHPVIDEVEIDKSNILMCGPSGVGKTLLAQTVARLLDVPFTIADATAITEAGYVGEDVESIVGRLLVAADYDVKKAERGIVFLDELDKKRAQVHEVVRDISGEGVQQALLKILEGTEVMVAPPGMKKTATAELIRMHTRDILFIVSGSFTGLSRIVARGLDRGAGNIGFSATLPDPSRAEGALLRQVQPEHLIAFGLIPELVGRLPVFTALDELDEPQLVRVLTEPKNALLKQYTKLFQLDGIQLEFAPEALTAVARLAKARHTNGRALRGVMEARLLHTQFRLPELRRQGVSRVIFTAASIADQTIEPDIVYHSERASLAQSCA